MFFILFLLAFVTCFFFLLRYLLQMRFDYVLAMIQKSLLSTPITDKQFLQKGGSQTFVLWRVPFPFYVGPCNKYTLEPCKMVIVGQGGAGKSTISELLLQRQKLLLQEQKLETNQISIVHLDKVVFGEKWSIVPLEKSLPIVKQAICETDQVIVEGAYLGDKDNTARTEIIDHLVENELVNIIVWIDVSFWVRLHRILFRSLKRKLGWESSPFPETWNNILCLVKKIWNNRNSSRQEIESFCKHWSSHGFLMKTFDISPWERVHILQFKEKK